MTRNRNKFDAQPNRGAEIQPDSHTGFSVDVSPYLQPNQLDPKYNEQQAALAAYMNGEGGDTLKGEIEASMGAPMPPWMEAPGAASPVLTEEARRRDIDAATAEARAFAAQNGGYEGIYGEKIVPDMNNPFQTPEAAQKSHAERMERADTLAGLVAISNARNGYTPDGRPIEQKKPSRLKRLGKLFRRKK